MKKIRVRWSTIILCVIIVALSVLAFNLLQYTKETYNTLEIQKNATPSPTANVSSVLDVTLNPHHTPAPTVFLLKIGVTGDSVKQVQERLKQLGYYQGAIDGQYGQGTADAVILFQNQHELGADGIVGDATKSKVFSEQAQKFIPTPTPSQTPGAYNKGDRGEGVKEMQSKLKELGYYQGSIDGDFGGGTEEAVRLFQSQSNLEVDGIAAKNTLSLLFSDNAKQVSVTPTPDPSAMPLLVNLKHPVGSDYRPNDLVILRNVVPSSVAYIKGGEIQGTRQAVDALITMFEAAAEDGITGFQISSGYRSYAYQQSLFDNKVADYMAEGFSKKNAISATSKTVAIPGSSEHHTGLAFDVTVAGTTFKGTKQEKWMAKNCWDYGYIVRFTEDKEDITGIIAEAWHFRYVGLEHSIKMRDANLCLEEYVGVK